jgi:hypothetical protein
MTAATDGLNVNVSVLVCKINFNAIQVRLALLSGLLHSHFRTRILYCVFLLSAYLVFHNSITIIVFRPL